MRRWSIPLAALLVALGAGAALAQAARAHPQ